MGEIRQSGKNASENLIRRTFNRVTFRSIIGSRYCSEILLAGLQAEVAAIKFSQASSPDVVNFARESEVLLLDMQSLQHPKIQEACIVGMPDPYRGETIKAFVVLKEKEQAVAEEINGYCQKNMAEYEVPVWVELRMELPESHVGKFLRENPS